MEKRYTITELASILGVHIQTLRKYEQDFGLLIPRNENNARYYTDNEKALFENIIKLKKEGLGTKAILKLLGRSVDAIEQREKALELVSADKLTGQDIQLLIKKTFDETLQKALAEQAEALKQEFGRQIEELKNSMSAELQQSLDRLAAQQETENSKLMEYIKAHRQITETKKGFLSRLLRIHPRF